jgi:hypothetical protein
MQSVDNPSLLLKNGGRCPELLRLLDVFHLERMCNIEQNPQRETLKI